jgi:hypothetical protein
MRSHLLASTASALLVVASSTLGCALPTDDDDELSASSANSLSTVTELRFAAFIPCEAVASPEPRAARFYGGDGRGFDWALANTRSRAVINVRLDPNGAEPVATEVRTGESKAYRGQAVERADGACYRLRRDDRGALPEPARRAQPADDRLLVTVDEPAPNVTHVRISVHANNPLVLFNAAPAANATADVFIEYEVRDGRKVPVRHRVVGGHDAFPSWELYINRSRVYGYDVLETGRGPDAMFPLARNWVEFEETRSAFDLAR